mgnify:CR=1 FL=1
MPQTTLGDFGDESAVDQSLLDYAERLKAARIRPIPTAERYPVWWGRLRARNQSPQSLGELDYCRGPHDRDDREEPTYEEHFVEIHDLSGRD